MKIVDLVKEILYVGLLLLRNGVYVKLLKLVSSPKFQIVARENKSNSTKIKFNLLCWLMQLNVSLLTEATIMIVDFYQLLQRHFKNSDQKEEIFEEKKREKGGVRSNLAWKHLKLKEIQPQDVLLYAVVPSLQVTFFATVKCQKK